MNISTMHLCWLGLLFAMLALFSVLGFLAMKPGSTQKNIDAFWISILAFLGILAVYSKSLCCRILYYIFLWISPILSVAPLFPLFIFGKLFLGTRKSGKIIDKK